MLLTTATILLLKQISPSQKILQRKKSFAKQVKVELWVRWEGRSQHTVSERSD